MTKTAIYLAGTGGWDEFKFKRSLPGVKVPSGVFFLRAGFKTLLPLLNIQAPSPTDRRPQMEAELKQSESDKKIRIYNYQSLPEESEQTFRVPPSISDKPTHRLLIIHHAAKVQDSSSAASLEGILGRFTQQTDEWPGAGMSQILVNVSKHLPELSERADSEGPFENNIWNKLYKVCDHVGIVISLSAIRSEGGSISRRLSWEQGIEDLTAELHLFPRLKGLTRFRHLFVRVGTVGFIHIEHRTPDSVEPALEGWTYFSPHATHGIHRDHEREGNTFGGNTVLIAALARAYDDQAFSGIDKKRKDARVEKLRDVFWRTTRGIRAMDDAGYDVSGGNNDGDKLVERSFGHAKRFFDDSVEYARWEEQLLSSEDAKEKLDILAWQPIPDHLMTSRPPNSIRFSDRWHILDDMLMEAPVHRINIAMAIVKAGHDKVLNRRWHVKDPKDPIWNLLTRPEYWNPKDHGPDFVTLAEDDMPATPAEKIDWAGTGAIIGACDRGFELNVPVMSFGKITAIEREDIEGFRNITNLLTIYLNTVMKHRKNISMWPNPISAAVFGPPGTGKTFAVKQIIKELEGVGEISEFNVAQFRMIDEIKNAFRIVKPKREIQKVPILFFDEFDSACDGVELGWLKAFLGPMTENRTPAILFFAGAVHHSFERFDPLTDTTYENRRDSVEYKARVDHFVKQKGPDFTSRLRGFLNILSIDDKPGRVKHFIRRALQLRGLLDTHGLVDDKKEAMIDDAIIYALLTMDSYRHGVRSMEAILQICPPIHGKIEIASLPSRSQLEMHVDAEEFLIRVHRGRVRSQPEWRAGEQQRPPVVPQNSQQDASRSHKQANQAQSKGTKSRKGR